MKLKLNFFFTNNNQQTQEKLFKKSKNKNEMKTVKFGMIHNAFKVYTQPKEKNH